MPVPPPLKAAVAATAAVLVLGGCGEEVPEALVELSGGGDTELGAPEAPRPPGERDGLTTGVDEEGFPTALPDEFPVPGGMEILAADTGPDGDQVHLETIYDGPFDQAAAFFETELPAAGWTADEEVRELVDGRSVARWRVEGHGWSGTVEVVEVADPGDTGAQTNVVVDLARDA